MEHFVLTDAQGRIIQPPAGSSPITCLASYHKPTQTWSFSVDSEFSQARMLASWGSSEFTISASGSGAVIHAGARDYTFVTGSVGLGVPLPTIVAEFEVLSSDASPRPSAQGLETFEVYNFIDVTFGLEYHYNLGDTEYQKLDVTSPNDEFPDNPYSICLWIDWFKNIERGPIQAGSNLSVFSPDGDEWLIPASAVWSFGNLLTYPGLPTIG